ncbi:hypothetical protein [Caudoviricetes sp.]|nr:hypothetical protein [Caudoviricetes sp.]UOF81004.1 hypothetical protein [Caudoviricetes sp.]UOF81400.1 hypothetical protein [Caudoviricetes sp.]
MKTLILTKEHFKETNHYCKEYIGTEDVSDFDGNIEIEGELGCVRFSGFLRAKGYIKAKAGSGIEAGEGIKAGSGNRSRFVHFVRPCSAGWLSYFCWNRDLEEGNYRR